MDEKDLARYLKENLSIRLKEGTEFGPSQYIEVELILKDPNYLYGGYEIISSDRITLKEN